MAIGYANPDALERLLQLRRERRISWRAFGLGMVIASFAEAGRGEAWPSRATLESISGIESRDIPRVTCELRDAGFIAIEEREGRSNVYRLTYGEIAACGDLAAVGKQPPTYGEIAEKPVGKQPPITRIEQTRNNEVCAEQPKPPFEEPNQQGEKKPIPSPQGNQTPPLSPPKAAGGKGKGMSVPKVTWGGTRLIVPDVLLASWSESYPHVDLRHAIKRAASWLLANPAKKKKNYAKFLNNWFSGVTPKSPEYIAPEERTASDAELIRLAKQAIDDPDERAAYWYECKQRGEYVPFGVECKPIIEEAEVV